MKLRIIYSNQIDQKIKEGPLGRENALALLQFSTLFTEINSNYLNDLVEGHTLDQELDLQTLSAFGIFAQLNLLNASKVCIAQFVEKVLQTQNFALFLSVEVRLLCYLLQVSLKENSLAEALGFIEEQGQALKQSTYSLYNRLNRPEIKATEEALH